MCYNYINKNISLSKNILLSIKKIKFTSTLQEEYKENWKYNYLYFCLNLS